MILLAAMLLVTAPKTGTLSVKSSVAGAKVLVDDRASGTVPLVMKGVTLGTHRVKVKKLGYLAADAVVEVTSNGVAEVVLDLLPYAGVLSVKAQPKGAQVFVDGKGVGSAPFEGEVAIGRRSVEVRKDGYLTYRESFQAGAGETYKIECSLLRGNEPSAVDVPLVALAPKKKKKADDDEIPLQSPLSSRPGIVRPLDRNDEIGLVAVKKAPSAWYQKWWVWGIVGGVVAGGVITAVVASQTARAPDFLAQLP